MAHSKIYSKTYMYNKIHVDEKKRITMIALWCSTFSFSNHGSLSHA